MRRIVVFLVTVAILCSLLLYPAYALTPYSRGSNPRITVNGNTATCTATYTGDDQTAQVVVSANLWQGSTWVDSWVDSGRGGASIIGYAPVESGKTYTLKVDALVNGILKSTESATVTVN